MPLPSTSIQPVRFAHRHTEPSQAAQLMSSSALGSV
jgi:hypothetical protein